MHASEVASDACGRGWCVARDRRGPKGERAGGRGGGGLREAPNFKIEGPIDILGLGIEVPVMFDVRAFSPNSIPGISNPSKNHQFS